MLLQTLGRIGKLESSTKNDRSRAPLCGIDSLGDILDPVSSAETMVIA